MLSCVVTQDCLYKYVCTCISKHTHTHARVYNSDVYDTSRCRLLADVAKQNWIELIYCPYAANTALKDLRLSTSFEINVAHLHTTKIDSTCTAVNHFSKRKTLNGNFNKISDSLNVDVTKEQFICGISKYFDDFKICLVCLVISKLLLLWTSVIWLQ